MILFIVITKVIALQPIVTNKLAIKSFAEVMINMLNIVNHLLELVVMKYIKLKVKYIRQILAKRFRLAATNIVLMVANTQFVEVMLLLIVWLERKVASHSIIKYIVIYLAEVGVTLINHNWLLSMQCFNHVSTHAHYIRLHSN